MKTCPPWLLFALVVAFACGASGEGPQASAPPVPPSAPPAEPPPAQEPAAPATPVTQPATAPTTDIFGAPAMPATTLEEGVLTVAGIAFDVSDTWRQEAPASSMRLAQFTLPGEAGGAELTVFCFGPTQGGGRQANIDRWVGQFSDPEVPGGLVEAEVETRDHKGVLVTAVQAAGTFTPTAMGPFAPPQEPRPDHALFGVIVEGGALGSVFVKVTGPEATIRDHSQALEAFASSARLAP